MWRSIILARRSVTKLVCPQVNQIILPCSQNPCKSLFFSTNSDDNYNIDAKIDVLEQNPIPISSQLDHENEKNVHGLENDTIFDENDTIFKENIVHGLENDTIFNGIEEETVHGLENDNIFDKNEENEKIEHGLENDIIFDENEEKMVYEIDLEKLDSVLSMLQSSQNDGVSIDSKLDEMNLNDLHEDFVIRVLETPLVPGGNLIGFFKWALKKNFLPSSRSLEALVKAISGEKFANAVWDLVKETGEKGNSVLNVSILNRLICKLISFGKGETVLEVFGKFDELGCVADSDTYFFTIDALCRRGLFDSACLVVEKMIGSGRVPDGEKVGKIVNYLCKGDKTKLAHSVYVLAKEKDKCPPRSTVNFLISSLSRDRKTVGLGLEMLSGFCGEERKVGIKAFSTVVRGLCKHTKVDAAKDLLLEMIEEGPPPGNGVFNSVINGLSKAGEMDEAKKMMKLMESRGLKPDVFTYTVIMSGYVKGGEMEEACKVLGEAKEKHSKLSTVTYHTLVRGYCKLGEFDKAVKVLGEMRECGVEPNKDEYNKLIQSLCLKALDWETAEKLMEEMEAKGLHVNGSTKALVTASKEVDEEEAASSDRKEVEIVAASA